VVGCDCLCDTDQYIVDDKGVVECRRVVTSVCLLDTDGC